MLNRLRWKIAALLTMLLAAALGTALAVQTVSSARQYREETDRVLRWVLQRGEAVLDPFQTPAGNFGREEELQTMIPAFCAVVDWNGRPVAAISYNAGVDEEYVVWSVKNALAAGTLSGELKDQNLRFLLQSDGLWTQAAFAGLSWEQDAVRRQVLTALMIFVPSLLGFFGVSLFLARWLVRPVEESWRRQRQFVADASHELKTPITVLLADADILLSHPEDTIGGQRRWVEHIRNEGLRMKELVAGLLFLAKEDGLGRSQQPRGRADLSGLCEECVMSFEPVAFEAGLTLNSGIDPGLFAAGSGEELRRLCAILLDNACKYAGPGGVVTVTLSAGDRAALTVHNTGEPIPPEAQAHLFERFYRADAARSRENGGYGLGLAIAAAIVERHRGKIFVRSGPGEGTAFTVALPLAQG